MTARILLVEDDEYKATDVSKVLDSIIDVSIERATSVTSALQVITKGMYDLVVLDMSLPTFDLSGPGGGGSPRGQGGLDVLGLARHLKVGAQFVVLTQYPDIEVDGKEIPVNLASKVLKNKYKLKVVDCIVYEFDGDGWRVPFKMAIERARGASTIGSDGEEN